MTPSRAKLFRPDNAKPDLGEVHGIDIRTGDRRTAHQAAAEVAQKVLGLPLAGEESSEWKRAQRAPNGRSLWARRKTNSRCKRPADPAFFIPPGFRWTTSLHGFEPKIPKPERHLTTRHILMAVAKVWDIQPRFLTGPQRETFIANPRQVVMAVARMLTDASRQEIGKVIKRDGSTVLHASRKLAPHIHATALELGDSRCPMEWARALKARLEA